MKMENIIQQGRLMWQGHLHCMNKNEIAQQTVTNKLILASSNCRKTCKDTNAIN